MPRMRFAIIVTLFATLCAAAPQLVLAQESSKERQELKERFKERYPTLMRLIEAGKIGETYKGLVDAVQSGYLNEHVKPEDESSPTVKQFLAEENKDRERLYKLLADELKTTPEKVAERDAKRRFGKAAADHYLKPRDKDWVQKKNLNAAE